MSELVTKRAGDLVPGDWMIVRGVPREVRYASESKYTKRMMLIGYVDGDGSTKHGHASVDALVDCEGPNDA